MFEGKKVRLRSVELTDLDAILENFNKLPLRRFLATPIPFSREQEEQWIRRTWENRQKGREYQFSVEHKETNEYLGTAGLFSIDNINRSAELGIAIHAEKNWGKGYGTDTMRVLLKFGFEYINLHRIFLRVYEYNERGIKTYLKVGFTEVGKFRKAQFMDGKYHDVVVMDILQEEWFQQKKKSSSNK